MRSETEPQQFLLAYPGFSRSPGICHVIVDRKAPTRPAVIVGQPDDNPGTSITNAAERVAKAIDAEFFHGEEFDYFEYQPKGLPDLTPTFYCLRWHKTNFEMPEWNRIESTNNPWLLRIKKLVDRPHYTLGSLRSSGLKVVDATHGSLDNWLSKRTNPDVDPEND